MPAREIWTQRRRSGKYSEHGQQAPSIRRSPVPRKRFSRPAARFIDYGNIRKQFRSQRQNSVASRVGARRTDPRGTPPATGQRARQGRRSADRRATSCGRWTNQGDESPVSGLIAPPPPAGSGSWTLARRAMTSCAKKGRGGGRLRVSGQRYVAAKGGATRSAQSATAGRSATSRLGSFLADIASRGFEEAARAVGLAGLVGQKADVVLATVINAIAPPGTTNDEAVARRATSETLREMFEKHGVEQTGVEALNTMKPDDISETIEVSVAAYVYQRWLFDLSQKIEEHAVSESEAIKLERAVKVFVKGLVKLKLDGSQALNLDWKGR